MSKYPRCTDQEVRAAVAKAGGNRSAAARALGYSPGWLYIRLEKMGDHERVPREQLEDAPEVMRVEVGLSALVDSKVVFAESVPTDWARKPINQLDQT